MTITLLKHGPKCGGPLIADISSLFTFSSPGIILSPSGVSVGPVEVRENPDAKKVVEFLCKKCGKHVDLEDVESVRGVCDICHNARPVSELYVSFPFSSICEGCIEVMEGRSEASSHDISETLSFFLIPPGSIKFVPMMSILKKSV